MPGPERILEQEPAVILAFEAIRKARRVNMQDLYLLTEQINSHIVMGPHVTTQDVENMLIRFMIDSDLYDKSIKAANTSKN